jgi:hypothetical protein
MVILSLKMDQYPFRTWDDEFSSSKELVYHTYYNMINIAVVDTLLYFNSNNTMLVGVKNDIHRYQMVLKVLINISNLTK